MVALIGLCFCLPVTLSAQSVEEEAVREAEECLRQVEAAGNDSVEYAKGLFSLSKYCRKQGLFEQSLLLGELAMHILEARLNNLSSSEECLPLDKCLLEIQGFLGDLLFSREGFEVEALTHFTFFFAHAERLVGEMLCFPDISEPTSWNEWKRGEIKDAIETLTDALKDINLIDMPPQREQQLRTRLKVLRLARKASKKNADISLQMAEEMVCPTSVSTLLSLHRAPDYFLAFRQAAQLYEKTHQYEGALQAYKRIETLFWEAVKDELPYLLPFERMNLWKIVEPFFDDMQRFAYRHRSRIDGAAEFLYENNLLRKEIFLVSAFQLSRQMALVKDEYLLQLQAQKDKISEDENTYKTDLKDDYLHSLVNAVRILQMSKRMVAYLKKKNSFSVSSTWNYRWKEVAANLTVEEAVVEFIALPPDEDSQKQYIAVVFSGRSKTPVIVPLPKEVDMWVAIQEKTTLYQAVWQPLEKLLSGCKDVYLALDDELNGVSFAGISDGKQYLCDRYTFHHLLSTGEIPILKTQSGSLPPPSKRNIYFFGGADFGLPFTEKTATERGQGFAYLPGTVEEIGSICKVLSAQWEVHKFIGREATESAFRKLSYQPLETSVIHISTHGFNLPYDSSMKKPALCVDGKSGYYDPLLRTGFVLTGANRAWTQAFPMSGKEDGILTAFEVADLNLANVDLVVLSACESGLGDVKEGEGVFGLQRAFRLAGAQSLLVSLWKVPDKETAELMALFYQLWQKGKSKQEAFAGAQRRMREKFPDSPEKWAGFILIE